MIPCTPHPGLGKVVVNHVQLDLATCARHRVASPPPPSNGITVRVNSGSQTILFKGKVVLTINERHSPNGMLPGPLFVDGLTPDRRWIFYAIDPFGSASYPADGLTTRAVRVTGGRSYVVSSGIGASDYRAWCGGKLVVTAGTNRIATTHKWLIVTGPPGWKAKRLVNARRRAFGSVRCSPDGKSVVVQSQPASTNAYFFATHWSLWRVGLDGSMSQLTHPARGYADESPQFAGGILYFVRSMKGVGKLYALRSGKLVG
ncbi:MAG: hypothetical protein ACRDNM_08645, partial [Gaiellaceae bacterium]